MTGGAGSFGSPAPYPEDTMIRKAQGKWKQGVAPGDSVHSLCYSCGMPVVDRDAVQVDPNNGRGTVGKYGETFHKECAEDEFGSVYDYSFVRHIESPYYEGEGDDE